jgi:hypothetical protein
MIVVFLQCTLKEKLPFVLINTLYSISLSYPLQTDRMTDRETNTLAVYGLKEPFIPVVLLCQFLVLAGNRFRFYILTYLEYNTVVALY